MKVIHTISPPPLMTNIGRPEHLEEHYGAWLNEMAPFLKAGFSLYHAMDKALLLKHKDSIYKKYRLNDWFSETIDAYKNYSGELVNSIFTRLIMQIDEKMKSRKQISNEEWRNLRFYAEKHRSCQAFFVSKQEVAKVEQATIKSVLDDLEQANNHTDYAKFGEWAGEELEKRKQINPAELLSSNTPIAS